MQKSPPLCHSFGGRRQHVGPPAQQSAAQVWSASREPSRLAHTSGVHTTRIWRRGYGCTVLRRCPCHRCRCACLPVPARRTLASPTQASPWKCQPDRAGMSPGCRCLGLHLYVPTRTLSCLCGTVGVIAASMPCGADGLGWVDMDSPQARAREKGYMVACAQQRNASAAIAGRWRELRRMVGKNKRGSSFARYSLPQPLYTAAV